VAKKTTATIQVNLRITGKHVDLPFRFFHQDFSFLPSRFFISSSGLRAVDLDALL